MSKTFFIPGNVPSSKNGKQWTGRCLITSKNTQRWVKAVRPLFVAYRASFLKELEGKSMPYRISFKFVRDSRHKFDYVNPLQTVQDMMTGGFKTSKLENVEPRQWLPDDNADVILPVFEPYEYDKGSPGVYITVLD